MDDDAEQRPGAAPAEAPDLRVVRRKGLWWVWPALALLLVVIAAWWAGHPEDLPASDATVSASVKAGQRVYVGARVDASSRTLTIRGATLRTADDSSDDLAGSGAEVEVWICRDGAISQTSAPDRFCADVLPAADNSLDLASDQLMVSITSAQAVTLHLEPVELEFREGLQRGSGPFGPDYEFVVIG